MSHRFWFAWSAFWAPVALAWAVFMATGMHWLAAGFSAGASAVHVPAGVWQYRRIRPRINPPSRHDLALQEIDRLERDLRMGAYAKTQAEFDAEIAQALHPFRYLLGNLIGIILMQALTRSRRRRQLLTSYGLPGTPSSGIVRRGRLSENQSYGQAVAQMIRAMIDGE